MTRFVVCGETLIDLVQADAGSDDSFSSMWMALSAGGPMNSAVALGKLGGKKGGDARAKKLTPEQRKAIAEKAARARWAKPQ